MITWGIIGLGWLGEELAHVVRAHGDVAWGTHRTEFTFGRDEFPARPADVLVLNTPPLVDLAAARYDVPATFARVIFVSSTSVYGPRDGRATEATPPAPATDQARWLIEIETKLRRDLGDRLSVVRPGGLIGGARHPARALARSSRAIDDGPVNLIHRADLIGIIRALVATSEPLVNAIAPHHPDKSVYYGHWAERLKVNAPTVNTAGRVDRVIDSEVLPRLYPTWRYPRLDQL